MFLHLLQELLGGLPFGGHLPSERRPLGGPGTCFCCARWVLLRLKGRKPMESYDPACPIAGGCVHIGHGRVRVHVGGGRRQYGGSPPPCCCRHGGYVPRARRGRAWLHDDVVLCQRCWPRVPCGGCGRALRRLVVALRRGCHILWACAIAATRPSGDHLRECGALRLSIRQAFITCPATPPNFGVWVIFMLLR